MIGDIIGIVTFQSRRHAEDQHRATEPGPQRHKGERRDRPLRLHQPSGRRQAQAVEQFVHDAEVPVQDPAPEGCRRRGRHERRQVPDGAKQGNAPNTGIQQQGNEEAADQRQRNTQGAVVDRLGQRFPEEAVVEQLPVIGQSNPFRRFDEVVLGEAQVERIDDRIRSEDQQAEDGWRCHEVSIDGLPAP
jgi:hypothetical protein